MMRHDLSLRAKTSLANVCLKTWRKRSNPSTSLSSRNVKRTSLMTTPVYFDLVPGKTINEKGVKSVLIRTTGNEKRHFTVVLTVSANGDVLPPMIIFKGRWALKFDFPKDWIVTVQEKGWTQTWRKRSNPSTSLSSRNVKRTSLMTTPVYFDLVPGKTINEKGVKSVLIRTTGNEKRHFTVVLTVSANGDVLPPMIIFKGRWALKFDFPKDWIVTVQEKGWMDGELMLRWIRDIYLKFTKKGISLLVLDSLFVYKSFLKSGTSLRVATLGQKKNLRL